MKQIKTYPINNSPLYKLSNKSKLAEILGVDKKYLIHFKDTREITTVGKETKKTVMEKDP